MEPSLEKDFTDYLFHMAARSKAEVGYNPSAFIQMLNQEGGYQTALRLLNPGKGVSDGFTKLYEHNRLDLSVEAICLDPKWSPNFEDKYLEEARKRLTKADYKFNKEVATGSPWSSLECQLIVDDYFTMLKSQAESADFNKALHVTALIPKLNGRTAGSVGMKCSNIRANRGQVEGPPIPRTPR